MAKPRTIGVVGGGTAGYFAALAVRRVFPDVAVTVVESTEVPIVGVGEATTTLMPPFLHLQLGLSPARLFAEVGVTFKLGIDFQWGPPGEDFTYPFGDADPIEAFAFDGHLREQSLVSRMMREARIPVLRGPDGDVLSLLPNLKFGYHLDNAPFVAFLAAAAREAGIGHVEATLAAAVPREGGRGIDHLRAVDGRELRFDVYVDATGFRSLLVGGALGSPFESYASSLSCDRALVATVPQPEGVGIRPATTAETMDAGWCWRIPVRSEDHRGYVYSSAFLDEAGAEREMRAKNPDMGAPWLVRFRSGRHREFWIGNTVAVGNAYGFVEPLESTALHMVILELDHLIACLRAMDGDGPTFGARVREANAAVGAHWDYLRWFLSVHYKFNQRRDTAFWRAARADVDVSGLAEELARFGREGPYLERDARSLPAADPAFHYSGLMMLLLGQRVPTPQIVPRAITEAAWRERKEKERRVLARALPQAEGLDVLAQRPELLEALVASPTSWLRAESRR